MRFGVLGPLQVELDGRPLQLGPRRQRALLARLLVSPGEAVSVDRIIDDLWGEKVPAHVSASLQAYVSRLRRILEPDRPARAPARVLLTREPGYALDLAGHELDADAFESAATSARRLAAQGRSGEARAAAEQALSRWRGPALVDLVDEFRFAREAADRLETLRTAVEEIRLAAMVDAGEHLEAAAELEVVLREDPFRERAWELLVLALYRSGRTAEALQRHATAVGLLRDELGMEPGAALEELQAAILKRDPQLSAAPRGGPAIEQPAPHRPPGGLPPSWPPLVGRDEDAAAVAALLGRGRLVTVTGPGGVGKTALGLQVARAAHGTVADEVVVTELVALSDGRLILPTVARALGVQRGDGAPVAALEAALAGRRVLLVLDNLEHLPEAPEQVSALLATAPGLTVLATSRSPLRLRGEQEYPLAPLDLPDPDRPPAPTDLERVPATRLFLERVRTHLPAFEVAEGEGEAIAAIVRRLDGLPLALELAAPWLRLLGPDELRDRLGEALPLLVGGAHDLPRRQQTVRDTVAWSYALLDEVSREAFARLAVFRGGWSLPGAAAVLGTGEVDGALLAVHAELVERSLVLPVARTPRAGCGGPRFRMLATIQDYGLELLAGSAAADEVRARHAGYAAEVADRAASGLSGRDQARWLDEVGAEHDNLRAALRFAIDGGDATTAVAIAWGIRWFWHVRGLHHQGHRWLAEILGSRGLDAALRGRALVADAFMAYGQGRYDEADAALEAVGGTDVEPDVAAEAAMIAAHVAVGRGDAGRAEALGGEAAAAFRDLGDPFAEGIARLAMAQGSATRGDLGRSAQDLQAAEAPLRQAGAPWPIAAVLNIRAMLGQLQGETASLLPLLRESLTLSAQLDDLAAGLYGITTVAEVICELGDLEAAGRLLGGAEAVAERTGLEMAPAPSRQLLDVARARLREGLDGSVLDRVTAEGRSLADVQLLQAALDACER